MVQGLKDKKGIEKNLWARIKKFIKKILYSKEQISITLLYSDMGDLHTPAVRPENLGGFSGDILPLSDTKNPPLLPMDSAMGIIPHGDNSHQGSRSCPVIIKLSGENLILKTLTAIPLNFVPILLPNPIHGSKQLNVRVRTRKK